MENCEKLSQPQSDPNKIEIGRKTMSDIVETIADTFFKKIQEIVSKDKIHKKHYSELGIYPEVRDFAFSIFQSLSFPSREEHLDKLIDDLENLDQEFTESPIKFYNNIKLILTELKEKEFDIYEEKTSTEKQKKYNIQHDEKLFSGSFSINTDTPNQIAFNLGKNNLNPDYWNTDFKEITFKTSEAVNIINALCNLKNYNKDNSKSFLNNDFGYLKDFINTEALSEPFFQKNEIPLAIEDQDTNIHLTAVNDICEDTYQNISETLNKKGLEILNLVQKGRIHEQTNNLETVKINIDKNICNFLNNLEISSDQEIYEKNITKIVNCFIIKTGKTENEIREKYNEFFSFLEKTKEHGYKIASVELIGAQKSFIIYIEKDGISCRTSPRLRSKLNYVAFKINGLTKEKGFTQKRHNNLLLTTNHNQALSAILGADKIVNKETNPSKSEFDVLAKYFDSADFHSQTFDFEEIKETETQIDDTSQTLDLPASNQISPETLDTFDVIRAVIQEKTGENLNQINEKFDKLFSFLKDMANYGFEISADLIYARNLLAIYLKKENLNCHILPPTQKTFNKTSLKIKRLYIRKEIRQDFKLNSNPVHMLYEEAFLTIMATDKLANTQDILNGKEIRSILQYLKIDINQNLLNRSELPFYFKASKKKTSKKNEISNYHELFN